MMLQLGEISYPSLEGKVSDGEWTTRVELAALFRAVEHMGFNDLTQAPLSARIPGEPHYLVQPLGILFDEITASSLVKIDLAGQIVAPTPFSHLEAGWIPLKAVHAAREDANFIIHSHDDYATALSARKERLLPISQGAGFALAGGIAYHAYDGVETYEERIPGLQASLADKHVLILENHGLVIVGYTAWHAIYIMSAVQKACRVQILAGRGEDLIFLEPAIIESMAEEIRRGPALGDAWKSLMRRLDRIDPSFRY